MCVDFTYDLHVVSPVIFQLIRLLYISGRFVGLLESLQSTKTKTHGYSNTKGKMCLSLTLFARCLTFRLNSG